jgi:hypothetical protein
MKINKNIPKNYVWSVVESQQLQTSLRWEILRLYPTGLT